MDLEPDFAVRYRALAVLIEVAEDEEVDPFDRIMAASEVLDDELDHARLDVDRRAEDESLREALLTEIAEDLHERIVAQP